MKMGCKASACLTRLIHTLILEHLLGYAASANTMYFQYSLQKFLVKQTLKGLYLGITLIEIHYYRTREFRLLDNIEIFEDRHHHGKNLFFLIFLRLLSLIS
jgi:hypothetical protein